MEHNDSVDPSLAEGDMEGKKENRGVGVCCQVLGHLAQVWSDGERAGPERC